MVHAYFVETIWGGKDETEISRKSPENRGDLQSFTVPRAIHEYNMRMGGRDTNNFHAMSHYAIERDHRCSKWTIRYFECLLSRLIAQACIIGNVVNKRDRMRFQFQAGLYQHMFHSTFDERELLSRAAAPGRPPISHVPRQSPIGPGTLHSWTAQDDIAFNVFFARVASTVSEVGRA